MSHGQGKPQNGQGNVREKSGNFVRAHGWTPWLSFKKMHLKMLSAKWRPFCLGLNVLGPTCIEVTSVNALYFFIKLMSPKLNFNWYLIQLSWYQCSSGICMYDFLSFYSQVKVVILGQDPYHGPKQAHGEWTNWSLSAFYSDVIMGTLVSQVTSLTIVYSTVYSGAETSKLCVTGILQGIHRSPVNSMHKWPVTRKMFPFDGVIMARLQWLHC